MLGALLTTALPLTGTAQAASAADWARLAACESSGNWQINTGNGYYGGLQFSAGTWLAFGGGAYAPRADLATPDQQMAIADKVLAVQGWNAWPACSRSTGLYGTPTVTAAPPMVYGAIEVKYASLGGPASVLGAPLTAETGDLRGGRYNLFQGGAVYWTPQYGAWEVHGAIWGAWGSYGWETSPPGHPISDEHGTPTRPGAFNVFEGGAVYWSPTTGAHAVKGPIAELWDARGWETGPLGFPTDEESPLVGRPGGVEQFEGGSVAWTPAGGAVSVQGPIDTLWRSLGGVTSRLGLPTSEETAVPIGRRSVFENGWITWSAARGAVVHYR